MPEYTVSWEIELDAEDPERAVELALEVLFDRHHEPIFGVQEEGADIDERVFYNGNTLKLYEE